MHSPDSGNWQSSLEMPYVHYEPQNDLHQLVADAVKCSFQHLNSVLAIQSVSSVIE